MILTILLNISYVILHAVKSETQKKSPLPKHTLPKTVKNKPLLWSWSLAIKYGVWPQASLFCAKQAAVWSWADLNKSENSTGKDAFRLFLILVFESLGQMGCNEKCHGLETDITNGETHVLEKKISMAYRLILLDTNIHSNCINKASARFILILEKHNIMVELKLKLSLVKHLCTH